MSTQEKLDLALATNSMLIHHMETVVIPALEAAKAEMDAAVAAEREACATLIDAFIEEVWGGDDLDGHDLQFAPRDKICEELAARIRARGKEQA